MAELRIGLVGYGEVGRILAEDLRAQDIAVSACDRKLDAGDPAITAHAAHYGVRLVTSHAALAADADLVVCAVTASQAVPAAQDIARGMRPGAWYLDFNSASPNAKKRAAAIIDASGGRYVEAAVMTSVPPHRLRVPMLLGGPHARDLLPMLQGLGFLPQVSADIVGVASAVKMCRSIVIKGMEAMLIESFTTARAYGVEDAMIASLYETFPGLDWEKQGAYFFQRVIEHGRRRAEEMREVEQTVRDIGLAPFSAHGTGLRQDWVADRALAGVFGERGTTGFARSANWRDEADKLISLAAAKKPLG